MNAPAGALSYELQPLLRNWNISDSMRAAFDRATTARPVHDPTWVHKSGPDCIFAPRLYVKVHRELNYYAWGINPVRERIAHSPSPLFPSAVHKARGAVATDADINVLLMFDLQSQSQRRRITPHKWPDGPQGHPAAIRGYDLFVNSPFWLNCCACFVFRARGARRRAE